MTATSITVNADLVAYEVLSEADIVMLSTPESRIQVAVDGVTVFPWRYRHERAWARILRDLSLRPASLSEADLADTSELKYAACACVAAMAYQASETKEDQHRAEYWTNIYEREINEVQLSTTGGGTMASAGMTVIKAYRC